MNAGTEAVNLEELCFLVSSLWLSQMPFIDSPGMAMPTAGFILQLELIIKAMSHRHANPMKWILQFRCPLPRHIQVWIQFPKANQLNQGRRNLPCPPFTGVWPMLIRAQGPKSSATRLPDCKEQVVLVSLPQLVLRQVSWARPDFSAKIVVVFKDGGVCCNYEAGNFMANTVSMWFLLVPTIYLQISWFNLSYSWTVFHCIHIPQFHC